MGRRVQTFGPPKKFPVDSTKPNTDPAKSQHPLTPKASEGIQDFNKQKAAFGQGTGTSDPNLAYNPKAVTGDGIQVFEPSNLAKPKDSKGQSYNPKKPRG